MRIKHLLASIAFFLFIDALWIIFFAKSLYESELGFTFVNKPNALAAGLLVYMSLVSGLYFFVLVHVGRRERLFDIILKAMLYGFCVYGVFTLTNYLILPRWSMLLVMTDLAWGVGACSLTALLYALLCRFD